MEWKGWSAMEDVENGIRMVYGFVKIVVQLISYIMYTVFGLRSCFSIFCRYVIVAPSAGKLEP